VSDAVSPAFRSHGIAFLAVTADSVARFGLITSENARSLNSQSLSQSSDQVAEALAELFRTNRAGR
jgi:hypothetical protein